MEHCETCQDTGYVCKNCEQADGDCICDYAAELVRCGKCPAVDVAPQNAREAAEDEDAKF